MSSMRSDLFIRIFEALCTKQEYPGRVEYQNDVFYAHKNFAFKVLPAEDVFRPESFSQMNIVKELLSRFETKENWLVQPCGETVTIDKKIRVRQFADEEHRIKLCLDSKFYDHLKDYIPQKLLRGEVPKLVAHKANGPVYICDPSWNLCGIVMPFMFKQ